MFKITLKYTNSGVLFHIFDKIYPATGSSVSIAGSAIGRLKIWIKGFTCCRRYGSVSLIGLIYNHCFKLWFIIEF